MDRKDKSYFLVLIKQYRYYVILIALAVLAVFILPWALSFEGVQEGYKHGMGSLVVLRDIALTVTPFVVFSYLYSKNSMDTYFAIPESRTLLFIKHFVFGYAIVVLPALIAYVITYFPTMLIMGPMSETFNIVNFFGKGLSLLTTGLITYVLSVLAIILTTNMFNGLVYVFIFNVLPNIITSIGNAFETNFYGYTRIAPETGYGTFYDLQFRNIAINDFEYFTDYDHALALLIWFAVAVGLSFLSIMLYERRQVNRIESEYMFRGIYPALITVFSVLTLTMIIYNDYSYEIEVKGMYTAFTERPIGIAMIFLSGLILYYIIHMIRLHGRPQFWRTLTTYMAIFLAGLVLVVVLEQILVKDKQEYLPNLNDVESVTVTVNDGQYQFHWDMNTFDPETQVYFYQVGIITNRFEEFVFTDRASKEALRDWHEGVIENYYSTRNTEIYDNEVAMVKIDYKDSLGYSLALREYYLTEEAGGSELEDILNEEIPFYLY